MSSENNNVYRMGSKNMTNIHKKLHNACNHASGVKKASKVKGMPFNPLLHDDVQRVAMAALLENGLYPTCSYITDVTDRFVIVLNLKTGIKDESGYEPVSFEKDSSEPSVEPTYMDDEVDVEEIINQITQTKTEKQLASVKSQVRSVVNHLKNNNFKAYEQIRDVSSKHEVKLTNNQS